MRKQVTNDIILRILQNTYLFRVTRIDELITELFYRYINTLNYINTEIKNGRNHVELVEKIESARAILYFLGYIYCESFGIGAIERRLRAFDIEPLRFYEIIDREGTFDLSYLNILETRHFNKIIDFYKMLKKWKNLIIPGHQLYLAEDYYNETRRRIKNL